MKALGLYIHVPFCLRKCHYCDFVSYPYTEAGATAYLEALAREIRLWAEKLGGSAAVRSIYLGGGTPTCLGARALLRLLELIHSRFSVLPEAEITVEANPETLSLELLQALVSAGVNRLSIGMQSANEEELKFLGRGHTFRQVREAVEWARRAGCTNVNLDLIFGLPGQDLTRWEKSLREAVALEPAHLSAYDLEIHPETVLGRAVAAGVWAPCSEEEARAMYLTAIDFLAVAGYTHYEISNFALPGRESRHNQLYWQREPYLGLGPGAHSFLGNSRWANTPSLEDYCWKLAEGKEPVVEKKILSREEEMAETMMLGLRLLAGISCARFEARFGCKPEEAFGREISRLVNQGLLTREGDFLRLTRAALPVANLVFGAFV